MPFLFLVRMQIKKSIVAVLLVSLSVMFSACSDSTPATPKLTLSGTRIPANGNVDLYGAGFTPLADAESHLRRPDGTEFPVIVMRTDAKGEFTHLVETWLLQVGKHELWAIDSTTGVSSNVATFEVTRDQPPPAK